VAMVEFALTLPFFFAFGCMALDLTRYALAHLKVSQIALNLADNISRMGTNTQIQQLRELDINDAFEAVRDQGAGIRFTRQGRLTLSSLENGRDGQRIHWQRCIGQRSGTGWDSSYGTATPFTTAGTSTASGNIGVTTTGMGPTGAVVTAPPGSGVMFVEANYEYIPMFGPMFGWVTGRSRIHYVASFIVRDNRDYGNTTAAPILQNSTVSPAPRATCNLYPA
jgi:Flp pilus assembly protein TadG